MRILAVGAHPDDIEIGCGGLLAMKGVSRYMLHLSNGETSKYADGETRKAEAERAGHVLGAKVYFFDVPGRGIRPEEKLCFRLVSLIRETRPDFVVTHWARDGHPDHLGTHQLVRSAFFLSGAKIDGMKPPWKCRNILYFHPFSSGYGFNPDIVVDITTVYPKKLEAIRCHRSQESFLLPQVDAVSRYFGQTSGVERAEPFKAEFPLAVHIPSLVNSRGH